MSPTIDRRTREQTVLDAVPTQLYIAGHWRDGAGGETVFADALPIMAPDEEAKQKLALLHEEIRSRGRDRSHCLVNWPGRDSPTAN